MVLGLAGGQGGDLGRPRPGRALLAHVLGHGGPALAEPGPHLGRDADDVAGAPTARSSPPASRPGLGGGGPGTRRWPPWRGRTGQRCRCRSTGRRAREWRWRSERGCAAGGRRLGWCGGRRRPPPSPHQPRIEPPCRGCLLGAPGTRGSPGTQALLPPRRRGRRPPPARRGGRPGRRGRRPTWGRRRWRRSQDAAPSRRAGHRHRAVGRRAGTEGRSRRRSPIGPALRRSAPANGRAPRHGSGSTPRRRGRRPRCSSGRGRTFATGRGSACRTNGGPPPNGVDPEGCGRAAGRSALCRTERGALGLDRAPASW